MCPATVPDRPADGWRVASSRSSGLWDDLSVLLPVPDTQLVQAIALARSLVYHNARAPMNLVLACDLAALRRMLGPLHDAVHANEASGAAVHVMPLESPPNVASAAWLAIELLPKARGLIVLEPGALVLGDLDPLWRQLRGAPWLLSSPLTARLGRPGGTSLLRLDTMRGLPTATLARALRAPPPAAGPSLAARVLAALEGGSQPVCWPGAWAALGCEWGYAPLEATHAAVEHAALGLRGAPRGATYVLCTAALVHQVIVQRCPPHSPPPHSPATSPHSHPRLPPPAPPSSRAPSPITGRRRPFCRAS